MRVKRLLCTFALGVGLSVGLTSSVFAHGERAQEAFLRQKTVAFFDVRFSSDTVKQGDALTITGTAKILETWPRTLPEPEVAYLGVVAPGPVVVMKERIVNGKPAPGSIFVRKGGVYEFRMTVEGRRPGQWHVHPVLAIEGAGSLLGPGQWITVQEAAGGFRNLVTLFDGRKVDLERYQTGFVVGWALLGLVLGLWWMWYWTGPKPTVTRLAVTSQLPINDDGAAVGLITKADHRFVNVVALLAVVLLTGGWIYIQRAFPVRIPQQVIRFEPPEIAQPSRFAEARATAATYDPDTDTLAMEVEVTNLGNEPLRLVEFTTSNLTFVNRVTADPGYPHSFAVEPEGTVGPGETKRFKVSIQDPAWEGEKLIPVQQSQMSVAGVFTVQDAAGQRNRITVESSLVPTKF